MAASRSADLVTKQIFYLYNKYGKSDYIGEAVSQQEHMIQCAMLAEEECYSDEVILGAFLHDIGHLLGLETSLPSMGTFGTHQHEIIGEQFLKDLGFPDSVTSFVRGHVDTKRYLVFKNSSYFEQLSPSSKETLRHQGGPMTAGEAVCFEKLKHFQALIKMRTWDDLAKVANAPVKGLEKYENMCRNYLEYVYKNKTH